MCGICGAIGFDNGKTIVRRMNQAMVHRGPDSDGFLDDRAIHLGVRRLRIIDLATGDQPIYNEDHSAAVILNGEIYNFQELYRELRRLGHVFTSRSDTEVVVHAYEQWGIESLKRLRGMYAFVIWDRRPPDGETSEARSGRLLLARDRLGIKPLYVWQGEGRLLFASEVRALLATGVVPKHLSLAGLNTYLLFGSVQEPLTMVSGVTSLPPASWLQLDMDGAEWQMTRGSYWQPPLDGERDPEPEQVRVWLADAVQSHLVSDAPLGAFLSGGLDSGTIVALGSQRQDQPMRAFTLAFDDWSHDEREDACRTAQRWQADHQVRVISQARVLAELPEAIAAMDQPTTDGINTWYVSREAREFGLTVALSGVGGDELFAGYPSFRQVPRLKGLQRITRWLPRTLVSGNRLAWLPGQPDRRRKLAAVLGRQTPFDHPYFAVRGLFTANQLANLLRPDANEMLRADGKGLAVWQRAVEAQLQTASHYDAIGEVSWLELCQYMRSTLLRDTDTMSMAHSLEVRVPFVDHLLVEHILPVAGQRKMDGRQPKPLLAGSVGDLLPTKVATGSKRTFTFPFQLWLQQDLSGTIGQRLQSPSDELARWLNPVMIANVWEDFEHGFTNWARPWALYIIDKWICLNL